MARTAPEPIGNVDRLLTFDQILELLQVSPPTLRRWVKRGEFPEPIRLDNGKPRWRVSAYNAWLKRRA